jgi:citrate lyase beta subunit
VQDFVLTLFTDDSELARAADRAGIDRIGIDLESIGKDARQATTDSRISKHSVESLAQLARQLNRAALFARCNPLHHGTEAEIAQLLAYGVRVLMVPYFKQLSEIARFVEIVGKRALLVALVETIESLRLTGRLTELAGIDELHFGLNDLRLAMGLDGHYDVLEVPLFLEAAHIVRRSGLPFGIGAVARPSNAGLPVHPLQVYRRIVRLGATRALVGRSFFGPHYDLSQLPNDVALVRRSLETYRQHRSS